ncbi:hypothetical protein M885DRAFT_517113 [Pelagophyceae sp. CCMP2097]|nr:hypothetical protein M885DRAFT_517113 [Pelagophyceae sp. CCMP2097]
MRARFVLARFVLPVACGLQQRSPRLASLSSFVNRLTRRTMATAALDVEAPVEKFRRDYAPTPYAIESVDLNFDIHDEETFVTSTLQIAPRVGTKGEPLVLDGEQLRLVSIAVDGAALDASAFEYKSDVLTLKAPPAGAFALTTTVAIKPQENTQLSGLYSSSGNCVTQCEAEGFRRITFFYDRPDVMAKYAVRVEADKKKYPVLLSNGNEVAKGEEGKRHWASFEDPFLKPSYLFALVAGNLGGVESTFVTSSGRSVRLAVWSEFENLDQLDWALESLKRSMKWDEDRYGREYDLDVYHIVAVNDFNMGAMENKGLNVFNTACVLAKPSTATDGDYDRVLGVVAHEYFHNWSGNRVTCRDWFQLTLKEGLTVFRDQHFTEEATSEATKRIDDVRVVRSAQFTQDAGPMAHAIRPESYIAMDNFYTVTVYNKGAEVIRMYRTLLGAAGFRKGMDLYFDRHDGQAVTCDDFRAAMADASGRDLTQFERWYTQAGTPTVTVSGRGVSKGEYSFTASQAVPGTPGQPVEAKLPFHIPLVAALLDANGKKVADELFELTEASQTFTFASKGLKDGETYHLSMLRGFCAPVQLALVPELGVDELRFLAQYDDDAVNRWDASQQLAQRAILDRYETGSAMALAPFVDAFKATLGAEGLEASLKAVALALPDFSTLMLQLPAGVDVDPVKLCEAIKATRKDVATACRAELAQLYAALTASAPTEFSVDATAVGDRRLRNTCLGYLSVLDGEEARCLQHFEKATCMSDSLAAAMALAPKDCDERNAALGEFFKRAKKNSEQLVINKWFALQASANTPMALQDVRQLLKHPDFTMTNPNRYRSVVNTFAAGNPHAFHAADGSGYAFIAEEVVKVDAINPQLAARLCGAFGSWRRYDAPRRDLIKLRLAQIRDTKGLSKDTRAPAPHPSWHVVEHHGVQKETRRERRAAPERRP